MRAFALIRIVLAALAMCLLCSLPSATAWAKKDGPSAKQIEEAKEHMAAGVAFMQDPDGARYEEAYPEFKKAYKLSGSLNALQNLAICAQNLELDGEAIELYEEFIVGKGDALEPGMKKQITQDLRALKAVVAWVTINTDKVGVTLTDVRQPRRGSPVTNTYKASITGLKLGIHPGRHKFTATADGQSDQTWEVTIKNGSEHSHTFAFDPDAPVTADGFTEADQRGLTGEEEEDEGEGGMPAYPFVVMGVTLATAVPMVIFMVMSNSQKADYDAARDSGVPLDEQESLKSDLETSNLLADVFMGVTIAGAVTTIILFATADYGGDEDEDEDTETAGGPRFGVDYTITPAIDPRGGGGAQLSVRF